MLFDIELLRALIVIAVVVTIVALMSNQLELSFLSQDGDSTPSSAALGAPLQITWNSRRWVYIDHVVNMPRFGCDPQVRQDMKQEVRQEVGQQTIC
jgi:hypothetical protein